MSFLFVVSLLLTIAGDGFFGTCLGAEPDSWFVSILGDPGMMNNDASFALEALNACNEVGEETKDMGSPRMADCAQLTSCRPWPSDELLSCVNQDVNDIVNRLKAGDPFPDSKISLNSSAADVDNYAAEKEKYLGSLCEKNNGEWYFWMIMLKNGNLDMNNTKVNCPKYGRKVVNKTEMTWDNPFPCFGKGCMNQPLVFRNESSVNNTNLYPSLTGGFYGSYDLLDSNLTINNSAPASNKSYFGVTWQKNTSTSSWILSFKLTTSPNYPWLSLFLRADAATGFNAGYHYNGRGIMKMNKLPTSPNFNVTMKLEIKRGGGQSNQFYLTDLGACWKNNGSACDGDVKTDVTRYVQMIINPEIIRTCNKDNLKACPLYHTDTTTGNKIYKNQTDKFPYDAYHLYCAPGEANDTDTDKCDPFTNPMQQELVQILPHFQWAKFGYPATKYDVVWEGTGPKTWNLDAGKLTAGMYFYQDPDTNPAVRTWTSINVGAQIYNLHPDGQHTAEWTVSNFDVLVPNTK